MNWPSKSITNGFAGSGPPVTTTSPADIPPRALKAVCAVAAVSGRVRRPVAWSGTWPGGFQRSFIEPPVGLPVTAIVWRSVMSRSDTIRVVPSSLRNAGWKMSIPESMTPTTTPRPVNPAGMVGTSSANVAPGPPPPSRAVAMSAVAG